MDRFPSTNFIEFGYLLDKLVKDEPMSDKLRLWRGRVMYLRGRKKHAVIGSVKFKDNTFLRAEYV